jgi:hypothetical protein
MALESDHLEFDYIGVFHDLQDIAEAVLPVPSRRRVACWRMIPKSASFRLRHLEFKESRRQPNRTERSRYWRSRFGHG